jgi:hypothetical protein
LTGPFKPGTVYTAIAPCNANNAPATCPNPPAWAPNSLGAINLTTGAVTVAYHGPITPKGMVFVPQPARHEPTDGGASKLTAPELQPQAATSTTRSRVRVRHHPTTIRKASADESHGEGTQSTGEPPGT